MTWESFYLTCFVAGLLMTTIAFVFGGHLHLHVPFHIHVGSLHLPAPFNATSIVIFVTWFGATGYIFTHYHSNAAGLALLASTVVGLLGGTLMYVYLARVLSMREEPLIDSDFDMTGTLGRISMPIRAGGTGELIYSQEGTRRSCGARSEDGSAMDRGAEVVVMRYDKGIAYVRRFDSQSQSLN
jgi:hypothetical protein